MWWAFISDLWERAPRGPPQENTAVAIWFCAPRPILISYIHDTLVNCETHKADPPENRDSDQLACIHAMVNVSLISLLVAVGVLATPAASYTNHTVGGNAGWFFNSTTNTSIVDYSEWAANQAFSLGDFLSKLKFNVHIFFPLFGSWENVG